MERLWRNIAEALIVIASINSILLCFVLAGQRQDFSWNMLALAIVALLLVWLQANRENNWWDRR